MNQPQTRKEHEAWNDRHIKLANAAETAQQSAEWLQSVERQGPEPLLDQAEQALRSAQAKIRAVSQAMLTEAAPVPQAVGGRV